MHSTSWVTVFMMCETKECMLLALLKSNTHFVFVFDWLEKNEHNINDILQKQLYCFGFATIFYICGHEYYSSPFLLTRYNTR